MSFTFREDCFGKDSKGIKSRVREIERSEKKKEKVGDGIIYSAFFHPVTKLSSNLDTWFRIKFRLNVLSDLIGFSRPSVWCKLVYLSIGIPLLRINRLWLAAQTRIRTISCQGNLFNSGLNENFCIIFRIPWK